MKRHPSLHALSEHHHHALVQALLIRRAVYPESRKAGRRAGEKPRQRRAALRRVARDYLRFWQTTGHLHFREEEEVLLPALARHVALDTEPAVTRMLAQHALIRGGIEQLAAKLAANRNLEPELTALGQLLHDHVRLEENQIFPRIEAALGEKELRRLGRRLSRLHGPPRRPTGSQARKRRTTTGRKG
ncbi:MAG: hemerythrin domain-containing protein [Candidatus Acidiferrales bacterium]